MLRWLPMLVTTISLTCGTPLSVGSALSASVETVLYGFQGGNGGAVSLAGVTAGKDGALYGTTSAGGGSSCVSQTNGSLGCGTVFELSPPTKHGGAWTETVPCDLVSDRRSPK
jgi:hypothetical protein